MFDLQPPRHTRLYASLPLPPIPAKVALSTDSSDLAAGTGIHAPFPDLRPAQRDHSGRSVTGQSIGAVLFPLRGRGASAMSKSTGLVRNSAAIFRGLPRPLVVAVSGYPHDVMSGNRCLVSFSNCSPSMSGMLMSDLA